MSIPSIVTTTEGDEVHDGMRSARSKATGGVAVTMISTLLPYLQVGGFCDVQAQHMLVKYGSHEHLK
jgi:hypothetical protein